jgi:hypothetical protein
MCALIDFLEGKMDFETSPSLRERASAIIVFGVGSCVFVFILNKIKVPPYDEVGGGRDGIKKGGELGGPCREARGVQVKVEGCKTMCAIPRRKLDAQGISVERLWEGHDFVVIKCVYVGGNDYCYPGRRLGTTAVTARIVFGQKRLKMIFPV